MIHMLNTNGMLPMYMGLPVEGKEDNAIVDASTRYACFVANDRISVDSIIDAIKNVTP